MGYVFGAFKLRAYCFPLEIGLLASVVLSTLLSPAMDLAMPLTMPETVRICNILEFVHIVTPVELIPNAN